MIMRTVKSWATPTSGHPKAVVACSSKRNPQTRGVMQDGASTPERGVTPVTPRRCRDRGSLTLEPTIIRSWFGVDLSHYMR